MKTTVYLRVGKNGSTPKVSASTRPNQMPLETRLYVLPTVTFGLELDIPDEAFLGAARVVARLEIPEEKLTIAARVVELADEEDPSK